MRLRLSAASLVACHLLGAVVAVAQQDCDPFLRTPLDLAAADARLVESLGRIKLGPFELSHIPSGAITVEGVQYVGTDIFFTFHMQVDARKVKAKPTFSMAGPEVGGARVGGAVRQLDIRGCLTIPGKTSAPRIEVPRSRFFVEVLTPEASLPTTLAGVVKLRGNFVELRNRTALRLSLEGAPSTGVFDLTVADANTDAVEILAEGSKKSLILSARFRIPGSSTWLFDLQNPRIRWQSGRISAVNVSLAANEPYTMPLPRLDLQFRQLTVAAIELSKKSTSPSVSITIKALSLSAGSVSLLGTPSMKGNFRSPLTASGTLKATLSDEAQIVIQDYELSNVAIDLDVARFDDGGKLALDDCLLTLAVKRLTASELEGSVRVGGGRLTLNGPISGNVEINTLALTVSGKREALDGTGSVNIGRMDLHGTVRTAPIDRCPGSNLDIDINGAQVLGVTGNVGLKAGKVSGALDIADFKAAAHLSYYRCEWDQKVGHLDRIEMNGIPYPCPTWSKPLKVCQDHWVLWDGGDVFVRWVFVANPTITDVGIDIGGLKYDLGQSQVCDGTIKGLTLGLYAVSLTPNLPASGTIFDVFRDTIQTLQGTWQTGLADILGPLLGSLRIVKIQC